MKFFDFLFLIFFVLHLAGCATVVEGAKGVLGVSTKILEDGRKDAIKKVFNYDLNTTYDKVKKVLKISGCWTYAETKDKSMIAVYLSEKDTTPIGIFFTVVNKDATLVEFSSPSSYAKEIIAKQVVNGVTKGESDVQEKADNK